MKGLTQKCLAELLGTFILVFGGSLAILSGGGIIEIAFGFGLALLAAMYAFGEVSGGHFNPIVTLGMFLDRRVTAIEAVWYWISQFVGAILASLVILVTYADADRVGATATVPHGTDARSIVFELVMSAVFVAVILQVTRSQRYGASTLIAIPLTLVAIHLSLFGISGSSVNPARSFAPVLLSGDHWSKIYIYLIFPPVGAIVGYLAHLVAVRGDVNVMDDLQRAATDFRSVEMEDIRQGPGQVPPVPTQPATSEKPPEAPPAQGPAS
jgi:aquaporin Z